MENIYLFNEDLSFSKEVEPAASAESMGVTKNGEVICSGSKSGKSYVWVLDFDTGDWGKKYPLGIDEATLMGGVFEDDAYDFYYNNEYGCYGYDMDQKLSTQLLNYEMSDLVCEDYYKMQVLDNQEFITSDLSSEHTFVWLTQGDDSTLKSKEVITYGTVSLGADSDEVKKLIVQFNKEHEDCRIELKDYSQE
jgi:hypothetical protein